MKTQLLFFGLIFLVSCSAKEFIINNDTGKIVAGYSNKSGLQIGMPFECDQAIIEAGMKEGLIPQCVEKTGKPSKINLIYAANPKYSTSKGISPGDSVSKVINVYGKPKATLIDYGVQDNSIHWEFRGLFYKNLTFFVDSTFTRVSSISLGD
ncbi:MAG: hypothetical protein Q7T20_06640 [Saprospiraceae bacterium]|nr:hypothetical protein [Saprospiraceae bacterium]